MAVFFRNHQWQVTTNGLEAVDELLSQRIPYDRLLNVRILDSQPLYEWPLHMAEKTWLDYRAFAEAYLFALRQHFQPAEIDKGRMELSIDKGREIAEHVQRTKAADPDSV
jgi:hypothetical protein